MRELRSRVVRRAGLAVLCAAMVGCVGVAAKGQTCTTQARMTAQQRTEVGSAAYTLASSVLANDAARLRSNTVSQFAGDFNQTAYLVRTTSERIAGDTLAVTQAYLLDASTRPASAGAEAEFACPLAGTVSETDFGIPGLPSGRFAFVMVEAQGSRPWLLAFLLQQENGAWKMAGFYPHERAVAGHDGLWFWNAARADAKANKPWLAWVQYAEAEALLRPASFVSTGNMEKLQGEQKTAAPEPLSNGLSAGTPLALQGPGGAVFQVTSLGAQSSDGGKALDLVMHLQVSDAGSGDAATLRNVAAATALLGGHPELRDGFANIFVIADASGQAPFVVQRPIREIATGAK